MTAVPPSLNPPPNPPPSPAGHVAQALHDVLADQAAALRRRFAVHGAALVAVLVCGAIAIAFALDRWLLLPTPIRLFHTAVIATLLVGGAARFVRYPLQRRFGDVDLAVWFERTFPALHQRFVSAIQLHALAGNDLRNQSRPMIDELLAETQTAVRALPLERLFDARPTRRALAGAAVLAAALAAGSLWSPATMRAFVLRHLGANASYPRETTLRLELPSASADLQRTDTGERTEILLPAGADLHVSVLAEGRTPKEVFLDVSGVRDGVAGAARSVAMAPRPGDRFRHVFRRVSGSFEFHARGGDDEHGDRVVAVRTVSPPGVVTITATVHPPAYTGVATIEQRGGAIEALTGSEVEIAVPTTMPVRSATMVFLESGRRLELAAGAPQDDGLVARLYRGRFTVTASDRYQVELVGENGLRNPEPGTYPIAALQDYAPIGRWLLPDDEGTLLLPGGLLCVRLDAHDDFGLAAVQLSIGHGDRPPVVQPLLPEPTTPVKSAVPTELIEVRELTKNGGAGGTDGLVLHATLRDNKQPQPGATELPPRIVQIVDEPQLAAAIARSFRGMREDVSQALDVQVDRRAHLEELVAVGERRDAGALELAQTLTSIEVGQSRIGSTLERVHRGLMRAFDQHLWNRLETSQHEPRVIAIYLEHARALREPVALDPEFYRDVARRRASGELGALERCLDPILAMLTAADDAVRDPVAGVARALAEAQVARGAADRTPLLQKALADQRRIEATLTELQRLLQDWNDIQDLIQDTRALRDRQRDIQDRTETVRGKK